MKQRSAKDALTHSWCVRERARERSFDDEEYERGREDLHVMLRDKLLVVASFVSLSPSENFSRQITDKKERNVAKCANFDVEGMDFILGTNTIVWY